MGNELIVFWTCIGLFLGTLYTVSIRFEITQTLKQERRVKQRNPIYSIVRILLCSAVLVIAFRVDMKFGIACLAAFLVSKYITLLITLKKQPKGE